MKHKIQSSRYDVATIFICFCVFELGGCERMAYRNSNVVIIYCNNLGCCDIGPYGSDLQGTPNPDRMAREEVVLTDFYVIIGVWSPYRSSLMTGSYAQRVDVHVNARPWCSVGKQVLFPKAKKGLNSNEITIEELLKDHGSTTSCIGKWHDRKLDGYNIMGLLTGKSDESPYKAFYCFQLERLLAIRKSPWNLHLPPESMYGNFHRAEIVDGRGMALHNLENDISDSINLVEQYPNIVSDLLTEADVARSELGDFGSTGHGARPGVLEENPSAKVMTEANE